MLYVLKLETPFPANERNVYYLGYAKDERTFARRMKDHMKGRGAAFTRAAVQQGIKLRCVLIIPEGTREDERKYKRWKKTHQVVEMYRRRGYGPWL